MASPPVLRSPQPDKILQVEPFNPLDFSPFGTAITFPLAPTIQTLPTASPPLVSNYPTVQPTYTIGNQSTALKFADISPLTDRYERAPSGGRGRPTMTMFSCFPRRPLTTVPEHQQIPSTQTLPLLLQLTRLERHPFTTQTFVPVNLSESDRDTCYLVVVAPTLAGRSLALPGQPGGELKDPPDLSRLRVFVARGGQAVTYGVATWHSPMLVLGRRRLDFVVVQFTSGVPLEDCQDVRLEGFQVAVDGVVDGGGVIGVGTGGAKL